MEQTSGMIEHIASNVLEGSFGWEQVIWDYNTD